MSLALAPALPEAFARPAAAEPAARAFSAELRVLSELVRREVRLQYRGTALGFLWCVANPLASSVIYAGLLGTCFGAASTSAISVMAAVIPWSGFAAAVCAGAHAPLTHAALFRGHRVAVRTLSAAAALAALPAMLVGVSLLALSSTASAASPAHVVALLASLLAVTALQAALAISLAWLLALANAVVRDVQHALQYALRALFWLTPVLWTTAQLPARFAPYAWLVRANPLTGLFEAYRSILAGGPVPDALSLAPALVTTLALAYLAHTIERALGRRIAELL